MNRLIRSGWKILRASIAGTICLALPTTASANILNTASVSFQDAAGTDYTVTSNQVETTTPPVITGPATATGNLNVPITPIQIVATNGATGYTQSGLNATGLTLNATTGVISGTPTSAGTFPVTLHASNTAGLSAPFTLTITIQGAPNVTLTKTVSSQTATTGSTLTYTIEFKNTGTGTASNVTIQDPVPAGTTLKAGSITGGGTFNNGTITWTIGTVAAGAAAQSVSFQVTVN